MALSLDSSTETLRQKTLETARRHKASWIELGQYLFSIQKDKLFKQWGFLSFETYCKKELDIKETTAAKGRPMRRPIGLGRQTSPTRRCLPRRRPRW